MIGDLCQLKIDVSMFEDDDIDKPVGRYIKQIKCDNIVLVLGKESVSVPKGGAWFTVLHKGRFGKVFLRKNDIKILAS